MLPDSCVMVASEWLLRLDPTLSSIGINLAPTYSATNLKKISTEI
jgi:hypothetical protein